jgi:hypothetical protein
MALAIGLASGLWMAFFAWSAYWTGHGVAMVAQWGEIYQGYSATVKGGWMGLAWGFADGFIFGLVFTCLYNLFLCCCKSLCKSDDASCEPRKAGRK